MTQLLRRHYKGFANTNRRDGSSNVYL